MDRVINIHPVFVDYDVAEVAYDSLPLKIFLSILLIAITIIIIVFFWDEFTMMLAIVTNYTVTLSKDQQATLADRKSKLDDIMSSKVECLNINGRVKLRATGANASYYLKNNDRTEVIFASLDKCEKFLENIKRA